MGAEKGSANRSVASGMEQSKKDTKTIGIAQAADKYAQKKLGIQTKIFNPNQNVSNNIAGYYSTKVENQMYGSEYNKARNEYLASKGLGTMRDDGQFTAGVQTDKGLVFTSEAREAYEATKSKPIPLSRQMYDSQKLFSSTAFAVMGALIGMPTLGIAGANYLYNKPYSSTVNVGRTNATYTNNNKGSNEQTVADQSSTATTTTTTTPDNNYVARVASLTQSGGGEQRKFFTGTRKTIKGTLKGFA